MEKEAFHFKITAIDCMGGKWLDEESFFLYIKAAHPVSNDEFEFHFVLTKNQTNIDIFNSKISNWNAD